MSGPERPEEPPESGGSEQSHPDVGSIGEEAAKLFGALADAARQQSADIGGGFGAFTDHAAAWAQEVNDHIATGGEECRYCPVCRVVQAVRETSPEVRAHLMTAASSLVQAAAGLLESPTDGGQRRRGPAVEHIDLDGSLDSDADEP